MTIPARVVTRAADLELDAWSEAVRSFAAAFCNVLRWGLSADETPVAEERARVAGLLDNLDAAVVAPCPVRHEVCRYFEPALTISQSEDGLHGALVEAGQQLAGGLAWQNKYAFKPELRRLFERFAFCDVIGPGKSLHSEQVTLGFVLLGPETSYPFHEHPAGELYYVLGGNAEWAVDFGPFATRAPGAFLLHEPNQPHAMRTHAEPLLAISAWTGNIHAPSQFSASA